MKIPRLPNLGQISCCLSCKYFTKDEACIKHDWLHVLKHNHCQEYNKRNATSSDKAKDTIIRKENIKILVKKQLIKEKIVIPITREELEPFYVKQTNKKRAEEKMAGMPSIIYVLARYYGMSGILGVFDYGTDYDNYPQDIAKWNQERINGCFEEALNNAICEYIYETYK